MNDIHVAGPWDSFLTIIKDLGGWGAFIIAIAWGGRAFMSLAREFSSSVIGELKSIREAISGQEARVERLSDRIDDVHQQVEAQGIKIDAFRDEFRPRRVR
jgi:hypothetical protein